MTNEEYFADEEFLEMLDDYERAVESDEPVFLDVEDLADIADYYQQKGLYDNAKKALDRVIELEPDSTVALNYMVHNAITAGDYAAAEDYLEQMDDHTVPEYTYCRAEIWLAQGDAGRADRYLRKMLNDVDEDEYQDYVLDVVNLYAEYNYNEHAMQWMMMAKAEDSEDFKELMARILTGLMKYDDAERIFNELIDKNPFKKNYWTALAHIQLQKDEYGAAVSSSEYAIAIDPNYAEALFLKGEALFHLEDYENALDFFRRYEQLNPDDELGLLQQGNCLVNMLRQEEAVEVLKRAVDKSDEESPYLIEIYHELAMAYSSMKMLKSALYYMERAEELSIDPAEEKVIRGHILLENDLLEEAQRTFEEAVACSMHPQHTIIQFIVSFYDNRYYECAYEMFKNYFESDLSKEWNEGYAHMALCCYHLKHYDEFLSYLRKACEKNPIEAKIVLGELFPYGMQVADYYEHMANKLKK